MTGGRELIDRLLAEAQEAANKLDWSQAADILIPAGPSSFVMDKMAWYLSRAKRYEEAYNLFAELSRRDPTNFRHFYMAGSQYYEQGRYGDALPWFEETLKRNPVHLKTWWRKANALCQGGDERGARSAAARVLQIWHQSSPEEQERGAKVLAKASHLLARAQLTHDSWGAVELMRQAVKHDPEDCYHHYLLGRALRRCGQLDDALASLRLARKLKPGDHNIELEFADALFRSKDAEGAITAITRIERRLHGWQAFKAGRLAQEAGAPKVALRLMNSAGRDRDVRSDQRFGLLLKEVQAAVPRTESHEELPRGEAIESGRVDVVRLDKGFGFLVDDRDGKRRHFRIQPAQSFQRGDRVWFVPYEAEKGPAARAVKPA